MKRYQRLIFEFEFDTIAVRLITFFKNVGGGISLTIRCLDHGDFKNHHDLGKRKPLIFNAISF